MARRSRTSRTSSRALSGPRFELRPTPLATDSDPSPCSPCAQFSLSHACWLLSYPISAYLVSAAGYTVGWLALAAITLAGAVAALVLWPRPDPTRLRHSHHDLPADHEHLTGTRLGGRIYTHAYVIDALHSRWPTRRVAESGYLKARRR
jgi:hypothetical protein